MEDDEVSIVETEAVELESLLVWLLTFDPLGPTAGITARVECKDGEETR